MSRSSKNTTVTVNSGPDVSQLEAESLSTMSFPAPRAAPFRVFFDPQAYSQMLAHASEDVSVEICGVLVGGWSRDSDGPFVTVRNYIRCDNASKKSAEVTFTHESWAHINKEMDTRFQDQRIVGWYHSHPNFGIFLSDRDLFIQQNFFSGPGQIALVIDPVRKIEGAFEWRKGQAVPTPHFWVGDKVLLAPAGSGVTGMPEGPLGSSATAADTGASTFRNVPVPTLPSSTFLLAGIGLFLMGWLMSGVWGDFQRRAVIEGVVAHLGLWDVLRPGLEEALIGNVKDMDTVATQLKALATEQVKSMQSSKEDVDQKVAEQTVKNWMNTLDAFEQVRRNQRIIVEQYSFSPEEREAVRRYIEKKQQEVSRRGSWNEGTPSTKSPSEKDAQKKASGDAKDSKESTPPGKMAAPERSITKEGKSGN